MYGNFYNPNPYGAGIGYGAQSRAQTVVRVNGRNGAETYMMPPNSSVILLDETAPIIWLKTTDGAGYPSLSAYNITPHQEEQPPKAANLSELEERVARLEEVLKNGTKSDVENAKSSKHGNAE